MSVRIWWCSQWVYPLEGIGYRINPLLKSWRRCLNKLYAFIFWRLLIAYRICDLTHQYILSTIYSSRYLNRNYKRQRLSFRENFWSVSFLWKIFSNEMWLHKGWHFRQVGKKERKKEKTEIHQSKKLTA